MAKPHLGELQFPKVSEQFKQWRIAKGWQDKIISLKHRFSYHVYSEVGQQAWKISPAAPRAFVSFGDSMSSSKCVNN